MRLYCRGLIRGYGKRTVVKGVSFDDLTIADWEAETNGKVEAPFTFVDVDYLDVI